ncbi:MAG: hypothetical protein IT495_00755 [Gammaproteobacteria bacterium]|nr:hypothetical protein [Gammaproteobacteria bacterium]
MRYARHLDHPRGDDPPAVLFVCSGNLFRSVTAEYGLRHALGKQATLSVGSAGTEAGETRASPMITKLLRKRGIDAGKHAPRRLTAALLEGSGLVIAMSTDHRDFIARVFDRHVPLFKEICYGRSEPLLDVHEAVAFWESEPVACRNYAAQLIDEILAAMPALVSVLEQRRSRPAR